MNDDWMEVGKLAEIPPLGSRVVQIPDGEIALFRTSDDQVFALRNRCPHRQGPLADGMVHGHRVTCPLHNWILELESGEAVAPDVGCAPRYPVRLQGDVVYLSLRPATGCEEKSAA
ncbi:MAG TPA: nitrite reductase small subunit NirD [Sedimenticola thiotaurini]|uniref:Nitrite reductase small subunit NirD n=1 Tax=Sedimenticola thiotaurini TaxID=1543721 RepID=A0A831RJQ3_9GAMM|nr:nitrite reductase small subunit NirD [Sedimenticola thiotaurini]